MTDELTAAEKAEIRKALACAALMSSKDCFGGMTLEDINFWVTTGKLTELMAVSMEASS